MAHDRQYKDIDAMPVLGRLGYPKVGDWYYNRYTRVVEQADRDLDERFLIMDREKT